MVGGDGLIVNGIPHDGYEGRAQLLPEEERRDITSFKVIKGTATASEPYHTRSVNPLDRCMVGGQLLNMDRTHSR